jgi:hypothetical protein
MTTVIDKLSRFEHLEAVVAALIAQVGTLTAQQTDTLARLAVLEADRRDHRRRSGTLKADAGLLSALAATIGSSAFSAGDMIRLAQHHPELDAAIGAATVRALGIRLRRIARRPVARYVLHRVKRAAEGQLWTLDKVV